MAIPCCTVEEALQALRLDVSDDRWLGHLIAGFMRFIEPNQVSSGRVILEGDVLELQEKLYQHTQLYMCNHSELHDILYYLRPVLNMKHLYWSIPNKIEVNRAIYRELEARNLLNLDGQTWQKVCVYYGTSLPFRASVRTEGLLIKPEHMVHTPNAGMLKDYLNWAQTCSHWPETRERMLWEALRTNRVDVFRYIHLL